MPNITLQISDSDMEVVNRARATFGESLPGLFVDNLRRRLPNRSPNPNNIEKITLNFWDSGDNPVIHKTFQGRWLVGGPEVGIPADDDEMDWLAGAEWSVIQTRKNKIVVYSQGHREPVMKTYDSFREMAEATVDGAPLYPRNVLAETAAALGEPFEIELDI